MYGQELTVRFIQEVYFVLLTYPHNKVSYVRAMLMILMCSLLITCVALPILVGAWVNGSVARTAYCACGCVVNGSVSRTAYCACGCVVNGSVARRA